MQLWPEGSPRHMAAHKVRLLKNMNSATLELRVRVCKSWVGFAPGFDPVTCLSQWRRPPTLSCSSWSGHLWTVQWKLCMWFIIPLKRMFNSWAVEPFPDQVFYCKGTIFLAKSLQLAATSSKCWVLRNLKFLFMLPPKLGTSCQIQMAAFSDALVGLGWESGPSHGHTATKSRGDCGGAKAR